MFSNTTTYTRPSWRDRVVRTRRLDVLSPLNRLTRHPEPFARQRCCVLIRVLAGQPLGKVSVVRNAALVRNVLALTADPVYAVRFHCAAALVALAEHRPGNEAMVAAGCAERVLDRLRAEPDDRVVPGLLRVVGRLTAAAGGGGAGGGSRVSAQSRKTMSTTKFGIVNFQIENRWSGTFCRNRVLHEPSVPLEPRFIGTANASVSLCLTPTSGTRVSRLKSPSPPRPKWFITAGSLSI